MAMPVWEINGNSRRAELCFIHKNQDRFVEFIADDDNLQIQVINRTADQIETRTVHESSSADKRNKLFHKLSQEFGMISDWSAFFSSV